MFKKILKLVLYCLAFFFILSVGSAILIPLLSSDSAEDGKMSNQKSTAASIQGNIYHHPPSGWRFEIPEGWQIQDHELAKRLYQESKEMVESSTGETVKQSSKPSGELALIHSPGNTMNYKYQEYDKERFQEFESMVQFFSQMLSESYKKTVEQGGQKVKFERSRVNIGGIDFDNLLFTILDPQTQEVLLTSQSYLAEIKDLVAMITFSCVAEETCSTMDAAVNSSRFE